MKPNSILTTALAICAGGLIITTTSARAAITTENFTFIGGATVANGQFTLQDGGAIGGFFDITAGAGIGDYILYTFTGGGTSSIRLEDGTDLIVDNAVNINGSPAVDSDGLAFYSTAQIGGFPAEGINLSADGNSVNVAGFGTDGYGVPNVDGTLSFSVAAVPEPGTTTLGAFAVGVIGVGVFRDQRRKKQIRQRAAAQAA